MSNDTARSLVGINETFALRLAGILDAKLGAGLKVKLQTVDQFSFKDHLASVPPLSYIAPLSLSTTPSSAIVEFDVNLVFPIIDLLLGGAVGPVSDARELSEIEEEIMYDLTSLIARQAEQAWDMPNMSLTPGRRILTSVLQQYCPPHEKVTVANFEVEIAEVTGAFQLVFPPSFVAVLMKQAKVDQPQKKGEVRHFPSAGIRERILDCDVSVAADLPNMRVSVRDLIGLQPGCVLKLRAPVRTSGMLTVAGREIFEAAPVRNGAQKAAQLGRRIQLNNWEKE